MKNKQKRERRSACIWEYLFPPRCPLCETVLERGKRVCDECRMKISYVKEPTCFRCGKEIADADTEYCEDCATRKSDYVKGFPAINYIAPMPHSIASFKYHNCRTYARFYAEEIVRAKGRQILDAKPEVLVPVPVHKRRRMRRGYNQAELLAYELGRLLHIPVDTELLIRNADTLPQKALGHDLRKINLIKAFQSSRNIVKYKKVLLVDDIYTTGATVEACAGELRSRGCEEVYYTSICIGRQS